jgi:hypothetical protein
MTDLYGIKIGTPRVCAGLLSTVLETRFSFYPDAPISDMYIARSESECLVLLANRDKQGAVVEHYATEYQVLLYVHESGRPSVIDRKIASETKFRFLEAGDRIRSLIAVAVGELPEVGPAKP